MHALVSIMIPAFNQPEYIVEAVNSALKQDYTNLEVIVSDDSTNNETKNNLKPLLSDNRLRYYRNAKNLGRVGNYRRLLYELAKGEWVSMLDGDDYYIDPTYISKAMEAIENNPSVVMVGAAIKIYHEADESFSGQGLETGKSVFSGTDIFSKFQQLPNHQTDIYKRAMACGLDFYRDLSNASDSESLYRLCLHGDVAYFPEEVAVWRIHTNNTTFTRNLKKQTRELVFIDSVYKYALQYLDKSTARKWRDNMYKSMSGHLLSLSFKAGSRSNIWRVLFHFGKFFGIKSSIFYFTRSFRMKKTSLQNRK